MNSSTCIHCPIQLVCMGAWVTEVEFCKHSGRFVGMDSDCWVSIWQPWETGKLMPPVPLDCPLRVLCVLASSCNYSKRTRVHSLCAVDHANRRNCKKKTKKTKKRGKE
jgi:hypothetical protein